MEIEELIKRIESIKSKGITIGNCIDYYKYEFQDEFKNECDRLIKDLKENKIKL